MYKHGKSQFVPTSLSSSLPSSLPSLPPSLQAPQGSKDVVADIISYYHPNLTINVVDDQTLWTRGSVPQPLDKCEGGRRESERREWEMGEVEERE